MPSLYIAAAILIWSSLGLIVRLSGVEVHVLIFYSTCFSLVFQSLMFTGRHYRRSFPPLNKLPFIFLLSACLLLNTFTFLFAYANTSIANAVLTHYIAPVIVAFLAVLFLGERITGRIVISILLASTGLWIMLGGATIMECIRNVFSEGFHLTRDLIGITSGLVSGVAYAVLVILVRVFTQKFNPYVLVFIQNSFMALILLPFVRVFPVERMWIFALMGALHSTAAPFLYYKGLSSVQANRAAVLGYLEPVGAIIFSMIFLAEFPPLNAYIGGGLILLSGYLTVKEG